MQTTINTNPRLYRLGYLDGRAHARLVAKGAQTLNLDRIQAVKGQHYARGYVDGLQAVNQKEGARV